MKLLADVLLAIAIFVLLLTAARAEKPVTHILAVHFFLANKAPVPVQPYHDLDSCLKEAAKQNNTSEAIQRPDLRAQGAEFVCLEIKRVTI